jgi:acetyl-CoA carboxylase/biotin carboxylase 1
LLLLFLELKAQYEGKNIKISTDLYKKGCVSNPEEGLLAAQKIGFPVMIKASEGGGGKGIRKVEASEEFASSFRQVFKNKQVEPKFDNFSHFFPLGLPPFWFCADVSGS